MGGNGLKMRQGKFRLDIKQNFFSVFRCYVGTGAELGGQLDRISKVSSNLDGSMILLSPTCNI